MRDNLGITYERTDSVFVSGGHSAGGGGSEAPVSVTDIFNDHWGVFRIVRD